MPLAIRRNPLAFSPQPSSLCMTPFPVLVGVGAFQSDVDNTMFVITQVRGVHQLVVFRSVEIVQLDSSAWPFAVPSARTRQGGDMSIIAVRTPAEISRRIVLRRECLLQIRRMQQPPILTDEDAPGGVIWLYTLPMEVYGSLFIIGFLGVGIDLDYVFDLVFGPGHLDLVFWNRRSTPRFVNSIVVFECRCLSLFNKAFPGFLGRALRSAGKTGRSMFTKVGRRGRVKIDAWIGRWMRSIQSLSGSWTHFSSTIHSISGTSDP